MKVSASSGAQKPVGKAGGGLSAGHPGTLAGQGCVELPLTILGSCSPCCSPEPLSRLSLPSWTRAQNLPTSCLIGVLTVLTLRQVLGWKAGHDGHKPSFTGLLGSTGPFAPDPCLEEGSGSSNPTSPVPSQCSLAARRGRKGADWVHPRGGGTTDGHAVFPHSV